MKILFIQEQPCIRAFKYAKGLASYSCTAELYFGYKGKTLNEFYGHGDKLFNKWFKLTEDNISALKSVVKKVKPHIIHCHNPPDTLTVASIRSFLGKISIVHDIHDLLSIRSTNYDDGLERNELDYSRIIDEERFAIEKSDGIIAASDAILELVYGKYNPGPAKQLVFPNYTVSEMIPTVLQNKLSDADRLIHIVYEGHLDGKRSGGHYDLFDIFKGIADRGIHIHIYPSRENSLYRKLADKVDFIHYHDTVTPLQLMSELTRYDFGWAGFNTRRNRIHTDTVLANKMVEYISAGLPVISFPHKSQKRFIEKNNVGIIIDDLKELSYELSSETVKDLKNVVLEKRCLFSIEKHIAKVYHFYEEVMESRK